VFFAADLRAKRFFKTAPSLLATTLVLSARSAAQPFLRDE
jgi:hypothetical protein